MPRSSRAAWTVLLGMLPGMLLAACSAESGPNLNDTARWRARLAKGDPAAVKTLKEEGVGAVELLNLLLADEDVTVVTNAGLVAEGLGEEIQPLAPVLLSAVVRFPGDPRMLSALRGRSAKPVLAPYLLGVLETGTPQQKAAALEVLTHYGPLAAPGLAAVVSFLKAEEEMTRLHAMNTLNGMGKDGASAIPELKAAHGQARSEHERRTAAAAIKHIKAKTRRAAAASGG